MDLTGKVYIVTGAGSGLGKNLVKRLKYYHAIAIGTVHSFGEGIKCDITNEADVENLFNSVKEAYGTIDGVVNCAAIAIDNNYLDKTPEEFLKVLNVNLVGTFIVDKFASKSMKKGSIVNVSSLDGINTYSPLSMDYSASKAGVINLTKNFALLDKNNKYLTIAPGWIDTQAVLDMDPKYLASELERIHQSKLLRKEEVSEKIIEMLVSNKYKSGEVVIMEDSNE